MYHEKSKKHAQTQHLYDTLKKRILMSQVETAASDNVARTLMTTPGGTRPGIFSGIGFTRAASLDTNAGHGRESNGIPVNENGVEQLHRRQRQGSSSQASGDAAAMAPPSNIPSRHRIQNITSTTPIHRTRLLGARPASMRSQIPMSTSRPTFLGEYRPPGSALRHSHGSPHVNRNSLGSARGSGLTAGMKIGCARETNMDGTDPPEPSYTGSQPYY
jgi:hypothetical protein